MKSKLKLFSIISFKCDSNYVVKQIYMSRKVWRWYGISWAGVLLWILSFRTCRQNVYAFHLTSGGIALWIIKIKLNCTIKNEYFILNFRLSQLKLWFVSLACQQHCPIIWRYYILYVLLSLIRWNFILIQVYLPFACEVCIWVFFVVKIAGGTLPES